MNMSCVRCYKVCLEKKASKHVPKTTLLPLNSSVLHALTLSGFFLHGVHLKTSLVKLSLIAQHRLLRARPCLAPVLCIIVIVKNDFVLISKVCTDKDLYINHNYSHGKP